MTGVSDEKVVSEMLWPTKLAVLCDGSCDDGAARMKERTNAELVMMAVMGRPWRRPHEHGHGSLGQLRCWVVSDEDVGELTCGQHR